MKTYSKRISAILLAFIALLSMIGPAYATSVTESPLSTIAESSSPPVTESSAPQTKTVYGYTYTFKSRISSAHERYGQLSAGTYIECSSNDLPKGYMGSQARLYNSNGVLFGSGTWQYTTFETSVTGYMEVFDVEKDTYYYSQGIVALYNGDGYTNYTCTKTPNYIIESKSRSSENLVVQTNENGEIFGSALLLEEIGVSPDLILAVGTNGKIGYLKAADLNMSSITTPEQAVAYASFIESQMNTQSLLQPPTIPLYESDGVTVIGEFELSYPDEIIVAAD